MIDKEDTKMVLIEPDPSVAARITEGLSRQGFDFSHVPDPGVTVDQLQALDPAMALLGPSLDIQDALRCVHKLKVVEPVMPILDLGHGDVSEIASPCPFFEGIFPVSFDKGMEEVERSISLAVAQRTELGPQPDFPILVGESRGMKDIKKRIRNVCGKDITVLITGETGTGKDLIARSIHYHSPRKKCPLVKINCGPLPDELLESEVFGFQKGAFTDAHKNKPGRIELAHGGTLFIDEIGNLSLSLQVKFLQILEDKTFSRLGATQDKVIDARVVVATNFDLWEKVTRGDFRKDLFYRLDVVHIKALPLRERKEDIPLLTHYFTHKYCFDFKKDVLDVPRRIADVFQAYYWPGNVRELENVVRRAIVVRNWDFIFNELDLDETNRKGAHSASAAKSGEDGYWSDVEIERLFAEEDFGLKKLTRQYVAEVEKKAILAALGEVRWNRKKAADKLQVSYKTLLNRIEDLGIKEG